MCELSFISGTLWEHLCFRKAAGFVTFLLAYARIIHFKWLCNRLLKSWGLAPLRFIFFAHSSFPLFPSVSLFLAAVLHIYRAHTRLSLFFLLLDIFKSKILSPNNPEICAAMQWVWEAALRCSALLCFALGLYCRKKFRLRYCVARERRRRGRRWRGRQWGHKSSFVKQKSGRSGPLGNLVDPRRHAASRSHLSRWVQLVLSRCSV